MANTVQLGFDFQAKDLGAVREHPSAQRLLLSKPSGVPPPPARDKLAFDALQSRDEVIELGRIVLDSSQ